MAEQTHHTATREAPDIDAAAILKRNDPILSLGIITFALVLITYGGVWVMGIIHQQNIRQTEEAIQKIDTEIAGDPKLSTTLAQYRALNTVVKHVNQFIDSRFLFIPGWNSIKVSIPKDMQFTSVNMGADGFFLVSGQTKSVTSVANFAEALKLRPEISDVTPTSIDRADPKSGVMQFNIRFKMKKPKTAVGGAS